MMLTVTARKSGHGTQVVSTKNHRGEERLQIKCRCGWRSPYYLPGDRVTAETGGTAHVINTSTPGHSEYDAVNAKTHYTVSRHKVGTPGTFFAYPFIDLLDPNGPQRL